jgi:hypothetical protein
VVVRNAGECPDGRCDVERVCKSCQARESAFARPRFGLEGRNSCILKVHRLEERAKGLFAWHAAAALNVHPGPVAGVIDGVRLERDQILH